MRLPLTLPEGVALKPHLRRLLQNYTAFEAHRCGEEMTVVKGTAVREVSEARLFAEREMLENLDIRGAFSWEDEISRLDKRLAKEER